MKLIEEKGDLFNLPLKYDLAHCISLDCAMGMGIAKEFDKKYEDLKPILIETIKANNLTYPITISVPIELLEDGDPSIIHNLITKERYWHKPSYFTITECIKQLVYQCERYNTKHLAMPKIGCGLDRLRWNIVKEIISKEFANMDIEIIVRHL
ncbi:MAG: macro domain-containing protein [Synergistaceae bacterium]